MSDLFQTCSELATHLFPVSLPIPWTRNYFWLHAYLQSWHLDRYTTELISILSHIVCWLRLPTFLLQHLHFQNSHNIRICAEVTFSCVFPEAWARTANNSLCPLSPLHLFDILWYFLLVKEFFLTSIPGKQYSCTIGMLNTLSENYLSVLCTVTCPFFLQIFSEKWGLGSACPKCQGKLKGNGRASHI